MSGHEVTRNDGQVLSATEDPDEGREAPLVGLPTMSSDFVPVAEAAALRDALVAALSAMGADR